MLYVDAGELEHANDPDARAAALAAASQPVATEEPVYRGPEEAQALLDTVADARPLVQDALADDVAALQRAIAAERKQHKRAQKRLAELQELGLEEGDDDGDMLDVAHLSPEERGARNRKRLQATIKREAAKANDLKRLVSAVQAHQTRLSDLAAGREVTLDVDDRPTGPLMVSLVFEGRALKNMDTFGKSDPYFRLLRGRGNATVLLHQSEVKHDTLHPQWLPVRPLLLTDVAASPGEHTAQTLRFECFDEDTVSDEAMGAFACSLNDLKSHAANAAPFVLRGPTGETFGRIFVKLCRVAPQLDPQHDPGL